MSLACCAATEAAWDQDGDGGRFRPARIVGWFQDAARQLLGTPPQPRVEQTIGYVLRFYRSRHDAAMPLPAHCGIAAALRACIGAKEPSEGYAARLEARLRGPGGWELQQLLLWHLGVCNHPVEADVLAAAPKIEEALARFKPDGSKDSSPKDQARMHGRGTRSPWSRPPSISWCIDAWSSGCDRPSSIPRTRS